MNDDLYDLAAAIAKQTVESLKPLFERANTDEDWDALTDGFWDTFNAEGETLLELTDAPRE